MANLTYADIIERENKYKALADLSSRMNVLDKSKVMTTLVELLDDEFIPLLAEKWSVTGYDGSFLAENDQSKRSLIKVAIELHRYKDTPWSIRNFAPARCTLAVLDYKSVPLRYNNKARYNGSYNHGSN